MLLLTSEIGEPKIIRVFAVGLFLRSPSKRLGNTSLFPILIGRRVRSFARGASRLGHGVLSFIFAFVCAPRRMQTLTHSGVVLQFNLPRLDRFTLGQKHAHARTPSSGKNAVSSCLKLLPWSKEIADSVEA